jgi:chromatin segregation and condensation protein Rec8/ScpA/Scc1 (kleisin family)
LIKRHIVEAEQQDIFGEIRIETTGDTGETEPDLPLEFDE